MAQLRRVSESAVLVTDSSVLVSEPRLVSEPWLVSDSAVLVIDSIVLVTDFSAHQGVVE